MQPFSYVFPSFFLAIQPFDQREDAMELKTVSIENPQQLNFILGHSHFIKTVEDLYEAIVNTVPGAKFGLAFCEASDVCLVRHTGTDDELIDLARKNALSLGAGHTFIIFLRDMFPVNILNTIKTVPEVCRIFCATANPVEVVVAETRLGRGILGVIDGFASKGVEGDADIAKRKSFLRAIGYKQ
jgi:adenosine/AMP kinase